MQSSNHPKILTRTLDNVFIITINRPPKRNAFDLEMLRDLSRAYAAFEHDPDARCALLHAVGDHTTGGLDLANVMPAFAEGHFGFDPEGIDPLGLSGHPLSKPLVMAVQGVCFTIGLELMLHADVRIAADSTRFAMLEVRRGIYPVGGGTFRLAREAGWGNAMRYLLTGDEFGAAEAYRIGIVQEVVPHGQQYDRALAIAQTIAVQAPLGLRAVLKNCRVGLEHGEQEAARRLLPELRPILQSEDAREGLAAFLERRPGRFQGC